MSIPITHVLSHFGFAFPFCAMSANDFYDQVVETVRPHEFPSIQFERIKNKEGGLLSASREYLRIRYNDLVYEICGMQFGKDFCITSRLYETEGALRQLLQYTWLGNYLRKRAKRRTFYQADREAMFKHCIHNSVLETVDKITAAQGMRKMSDVERQMK